MESNEVRVTTDTYTSEPTQFGTTISHYVYETGWYHYDGQTSTRQLTDAGQNIINTITYAAFGEEIQSTGYPGEPFRYCGATGYYSSPLGVRSG